MKWATNGRQVTVERADSQVLDAAYNVFLDGRAAGAVWQQACTPVADHLWVSADCRRQDPAPGYHCTREDAVRALTWKEALILACSHAKRTPGEDIWAVDGKAPAVCVYDGPWWKILRRYNPHLRVFALSGQFGLIPAHTLIPHYDLKMRPVLSASWISKRLLPKASLLTGFDAVWTCVPQTGGYATAVEILEAHLVEGGTAVPFRDVAGVLELPTDKALLARNPYFARTRALTILCRERSFRLAHTPMPQGESGGDWQRLMDEGAILGW
jgi:hypothetical protein